MAGSIQWFRWYHGSVTDPKFQLVARKANVRMPDVLAVWAFVLETASAAEHRGMYGAIDCESVDCLLGLDDGATSEILTQMHERNLLADGFVVAWEKRQPKREREGDNSTSRSRAFRERQRHATPCNAMQHQETPREEKRREETITPKPPAQAPEVLERFGRFWNAYPRKTAKANAQKSFVKIKPTEELLETMLKALEWQKEQDSWKKDDGKFIPHPASWLNAARWEDEPAVASPDPDDWRKNPLFAGGI